MEGLSRSISKGLLPRSVSSSLDVNRVWRRTCDGFDGRRSMKTAQFGKRQGMFWQIKKLFNMACFQQLGATKTSTSKPRQASNPDDDFQNRMLFEIYKNMSSSRDLGPV